jgi:hypothetical protein
MKWVTRVRLEGPTLHPFKYGALVPADIIVLFNKWETRFKAEWENVGRDRRFMRGQR